MYRFVLCIPWLLVACAKPWPTIEPLALEPLSPSSEEWRVIDHVIVITDASGTMGKEALFPEARELTRSLFSGMPALEVAAKGAPEYKASLIAFGGGDRHGPALAPFDRLLLVSSAERMRLLGGPPLGGTTPLADVIDEAAGALSSESGPAALVIIGDGLANDPAGAIESTRSLVAGYADGVCVHAVHTGEDAEGLALLRQLVGFSTNGCGTVREISSVADAASVEGFERTIFLGDAPLPQVAATPEPTSPCDGRIVLRGVTFQLDRAVLLPESRPVLDFAAEQLRGCKDRRVVVEGHTCSLGSDAYNLSLSERRASAVREYLKSQGVAEEQLAARGMGEANPVADNGTEGGRSQNRRVELVPVEP